MTTTTDTLRAALQAAAATIRDAARWVESPGTAKLLNERAAAAESVLSAHPARAAQEPDERIEFEKWAREYTTLSLQRDADDPESYHRASTDGPWLAWQARADLASRKAP